MGIGMDRDTYFTYFSIDILYKKYLFFRAGRVTSVKIEYPSPITYIKN